MSQKDTLVIIGNGFDIWQGFNTSYADFQTYYLKHRDEILKKLKIKKKYVRRKNGAIYEISDVELIYGNPFRPAELDMDFWFTFENSLGELDAHRLNFFFGKEKKGLKAMDKSIKNANRILREAFCSWIATIRVDETDSGLRFNDNCCFINFNYTDTLEKRFGVRKRDIIHIHGEADDAESIIVGHAIHPQEPEDILYRLGGRFRGLFLIDYILYQTDKHVRDNITMLCLELSMKNIAAGNIKDIYVLGHSLGGADLEYFTFLKEAITGEATDTGAIMSEEGDSLDELHNRIQYIIKKYGMDPSIIDTVTQEEKDAIRRKFLREQQKRDAVVEQTCRKALQKGIRRRRGKASARSDQMHRTSDAVRSDEQVSSVSQNPAGEDRRSDVRWHITYYSEADKRRAEDLMKMLGCTDYELFADIDEAVEQIRKK